ncbi:hypothetical protein Dimus_019546 [Dionaea muscipula]
MGEKGESGHCTVPCPPHPTEFSLYLFLSLKCVHVQKPFNIQHTCGLLFFSFWLVLLCFLCNCLFQFSCFCSLPPSFSVRTAEWGKVESCFDFLVIVLFDCSSASHLSLLVFFFFFFFGYPSSSNVFFLVAYKTPFLLAFWVPNKNGFP